MKIFSIVTQKLFVYKKHSVQLLLAKLPMSNNCVLLLIFKCFAIQQGREFLTRYGSFNLFCILFLSGLELSVQVTESYRQNGALKMVIVFERNFYCNGMCFGMVSKVPQHKASPEISIRRWYFA